MFDRRNIHWPLELVVKTAADEGFAALTHAVENLSGESVGFLALLDADTESVLLGGDDERQLEKSLLALRGAFGRNLDESAPRVGYRLSVTGTGQAVFMDGERNCLDLCVEPLAGYELRVELAGLDGIPSDAIIKGILSAAETGVWGYPLIGTKVNISRREPPDEVADCAPIGSGTALREALSRAGPILLEPIVAIEVVLPEGYEFALLGELQRSRGGVLASQDDGELRTVSGFLPASGILGFSNRLNHLMLGEATFSFRFDRYDRVLLFSGDDPSPSEPASAALRRPA